MTDKVSLRLITVLGHQWEAGFARAVEESTQLALVRRCADLADLLATASAGLADVAVVSPEVRWLDRDALRHLSAHGVRVAGALTAGDETGERRLRQLGVTTMMSVTASVADIEQALSGSLAIDAGPFEGVDGFDGIDGIAGLDGINRGLAGLPAKLHDAQGDNPESPLAGPDSSPQPGRVVAVWGPIGAPGRTTLAIGIAAELAASGVPTLLADADTYGASIAQALSLLDEAPGMAAAARASEQGTLDLPALARLAPQVSDNLRVLTGIPRADRWPELRAAAVEHILDLARQLAECVVVDCGFSIEEDEELSYDTVAPRRNAATLTALAYADDLIVVGSADPIGLQRLVRAVQDVGTVPSPRPRVVVNKVRAGAVGPRPERAIREALSRFAGMDTPAFVPFDPATLDAAMLAGRSVVEHAPHTAVRGAIATIARSCLPMPVPATRTARRRVPLGR